MSKPHTAVSTIVQAHQISTAYDGRKIFAPVSFSATPGQIVELRGANGVGKTTMLRVLAGLIRPATGYIGIRINDKNATPADIHLIGHGDTVKNTLPTLEQARYWAALLGASDNTVTKALEQMGLNAYVDIPGHALSAGIRRRLALSRLMLADRRIWLLDEPFASLDDQGKDLIATMIEQHTDKGGIVIATMHGNRIRGAQNITIEPPQRRSTVRACDHSGDPTDADHKPVVARTSVRRAFMAVFVRELSGSLSHRLIPPVGMYLGCSALVPLAAGPANLDGFAAPMTVIALALAALLPAEQMFASDVKDGTLDAMLACCAVSAELVALAKLLAIWAGVGLPLALVSPVAWMTLGGPADSSLMCVIVTVMAAGGFVLFAGMAGSLSVALPRSGIVMIVVALPFFWPMMIFATATLRAHAAGEPFVASLYLTSSSLLFAIAVTPFAVARALRAATE